MTTTNDDLLRACRAVYPGTDTSRALEASRREMYDGEHLNAEAQRAHKDRRHRIAMAHSEAIYARSMDPLDGAARSVADYIEDPFPPPAPHESAMLVAALERLPMLLRGAAIVGTPRLALAAAFARAMLRAHADGATRGYSVSGAASALDAMIVRACQESKGALSTADVLERAAREEAAA